MKLFQRNKKAADYRPEPTRAVRRLRHQLDEAHDVHALTGDPLLAVVNADRLRVSISRSLWWFLAIGLGFTTTGVHDFLAGRLTLTDPLWWGAWLVEPALAGILITVLRWESEMLARGQRVDDGPVVKLKRLLLAATLITNVWSAVSPSKGPVSAGNVFLHVVIPVVVFLLAEVMPIVQQRCVAVRDVALRDAARREAPRAMPAESAPAPSAAENTPAVARVTPAMTSTNPDPFAGLRLPAPMRTTLTARMTELGRPLTAPEVSELLRLPADFATRVADQLAA
ncbi:hypothetical protein [Lentzea flava]|uniref:DUF2637 domain-containing protein n=1 Tax=Lentzea flava TaxID=103732 RepID=A0ABQ2UGT8_9PSEU|nr:hypothetical protein [Lentzea flava]MCP2198645.1 hypothetical protein [Lentzea flava]GGU29086.1 hypothetical protein GCM10010178_21550 [Lentzea flava]